MPKPIKGQKQEDYLAKFMGDAEMVSKHPDSKQRYAIAMSEWERHKKMHEGIIENISFNFMPEYAIEEMVQEASGVKKVKIGGTALVEGISANKREYSKQNLAENDGKEFKWLFEKEKDGFVLKN